MTGLLGKLLDIFVIYLMGVVLGKKSDFFFVKIIGKGAGGTVYKCTRGSMQFAVKKTYKASRGTMCSKVHSMVRLSRTGHIVQIYAAWCEESSSLCDIYIAMELFERYLLKLK